MLAITDLHASIGSSHILQGVTMSVPEHRVTVILGRNGVGKTTTLRAVLGLVSRDGEVTVRGRRVDQLRTDEIARFGVSYVPEDRDVFHGLTVLENLRLAERKASRPRYDIVYELFPELERRARQMAGTLSGGQQQMLALGRGLLNLDPLILIDEPTKGLSPRLVGEVITSLERVQDLSTIVMVEQNLRAAHRLAGHVVVMSEGRVTYEGDRAILDDEQRIRVMLGLASDGRSR